MSLRLLEAFFPEVQDSQVQAALDRVSVLGRWRQHTADGQILVHVLVRSSDVEAVLEVLAPLSGATGWRVVLLPVEATLPRPEEEPEAADAPAPPDAPRVRQRLSREELYADLEAAVSINSIYLLMVTLSVIVAAIGLLKDNVAVVIGAMVIAPLLGPNVALALATTLADFALARRALQANVLGVAVAFALSWAIGWTFSAAQLGPALESIPEILARTQIGLADIVLALVSGVAAALSVTTGVPTSLIGVMVAVALLPPLAAFGLLLGAGAGALAVRALLLLLSNVICVNLAGVLTFWAQGVRPAAWWEADRARRAAWLAMGIWTLLLAGLVALVLLSQAP